VRLRECDSPFGRPVSVRRRPSGFVADGSQNGSQRPTPDQQSVDPHWEPEYNGDMSLERITVDPNRMGGLPCIRDLRVTVGMILGQLAAGQTRAQILADYPYLEDADIAAALAYGAARVNERDLPLAPTA